MSKQSRPGYVICFVLAILIALLASRTTAKSADLAPDSYIGNEACARCHAAIYDSYRQTAMAHGGSLKTFGL